MTGPDTVFDASAALARLSDERDADVVVIR